MGIRGRSRSSEIGATDLRRASVVSWVFIAALKTLLHVSVVIRAQARIAIGSRRFERIGGEGWGVHVGYVM
jgi:hypothetical protein